MTTDPPALRYPLTRALCLVVLLIVVIAAVYAAWIGVVNFNRIRV